VAWRLNIARIKEYGAEINKLTIYKTDFVDNMRNICGHSYQFTDWEN
jgi:hypothetical protein